MDKQKKQNRKHSDAERRYKEKLAQSNVNTKVEEFKGPVRVQS